METNLSNCGDPAVTGHVPRNWSHCLSDLDLAMNSFAGVLTLADTFRLIVSSLAGNEPFGTVVLLLTDEARTGLRVARAEGSRADAFSSLTAELDQGAAGQCYIRKQIISDPRTAAIPLTRGSQVFGVLALYFDEWVDNGSVDLLILEALQERISPLILTSLSLERSRQNALTDATTDLPNERAFRLELEHRVAEAHGREAVQPLTLLAIDIKDFSEINQRLGHAAGDEVLNHAARVIKDNLRQMDLLARSTNDEFLAVLPTASAKVAHEVIGRIKIGLVRAADDPAQHSSMDVELNFGWAVFGTDGDTPEQLLATARLRKGQAKSPASANVLWFGK